VKYELLAETEDLPSVTKGREEKRTVMKDRGKKEVSHAEGAACEKKEKTGKPVIGPRRTQ